MDYSHELRRMINKSLQSTEQWALEDVLALDASVFNFTKTGSLSSVSVCRTQHQINAGHANPIRHKPNQLYPAERKIIQDQVEEMLHKGVSRILQSLGRTSYTRQKQRQHTAILRRLPSIERG